MTSSYHGAYKQSTTHNRTLRDIPLPAIMEKVRVRAIDLAQQIWMVERWKSSITTKIPSYLETLARGTTHKIPQGVPAGILYKVQRCFAQACIEHDAIGLNGQSAPWYKEVVEAAMGHMKSVES